MIWPGTLKSRAEKEVYLLIDKHFKKLPKNPDGIIRAGGTEFEDNDVDALRHAYVSGVFTWEYGEIAADVFGRLNEALPAGGVSASNSAEAMNMDLWNNAVGRKYGNKYKTRKELFQNLLKALKNGELIIDPDNDKRKYLGDGEIKNANGVVIVLQESKKGKNRIFYDVNKNVVLKKNEFVTLIKNGSYPNYELRVMKGDEIPVSKKDSSVINNLG